MYKLLTTPLIFLFCRKKRVHTSEKVNITVKKL